MPQPSPQEWWERITVAGDQLADRVAELIREGNVRHLIIKHGEHTLLEIPVTLGLVGAVLAPVLAGVAAAGALLTNCTIEVNRVTPPGGQGGQNDESASSRAESTS